MCINTTTQPSVGAQLIGAPPIYRPGKGIDGPLADKSAMGAINRPLRDDRFRLFTFIIGFQLIYQNR